MVPLLFLLFLACSFFVDWDSCYYGIEATKKNYWGLRQSLLEDDHQIVRKRRRVYGSAKVH